MEDAIRDFYVPAMLQLDAKKISDQFRQMLPQDVKQDGLNLRDPAQLTERLH